jgi:carbonic anhydrase
MSSSIVSEVLAHNVEKFVPAFTAGDKPMPPGRKALILACMDARLHPESTFGLNIGDSHCVRNAGEKRAHMHMWRSQIYARDPGGFIGYLFARPAGGRASDDALRSIAISQQLLGTREVGASHALSRAAAAAHGSGAGHAC